MKVLCIADIHGNSQWFKWILENSPRFDLIILPGDFVDGYDQRDLSLVLGEVQGFFKELEQIGVPVLMCSGNHDDGLKRISNPLYSWTDGLKKPHKVWGNGDIGTLTIKGRDLLFSCHQDNEFGKEPITCKLEKDFEKAHELAQVTGLPWIVVHHCPPDQCLVSKGDIGGSRILRKLIERFQPDFVFSGHLHQAPMAGDCVDKIGKTVCFNAGHRKNSMIPNRLELDLLALNGTWFYAGDQKKRIDFSTKENPK
jgi:Icc-related predicted phosphoesterase